MGLSAVGFYILAAAAAALCVAIVVALVSRRSRNVFRRRIEFGDGRAEKASASPASAEDIKRAWLLDAHLRALARATRRRGDTVRLLGARRQADDGDRERDSADADEAGASGGRG